MANARRASCTTGDRSRRRAPSTQAVPRAPRPSEHVPRRAGRRPAAASVMGVGNAAAGVLARAGNVANSTATSASHAAVDVADAAGATAGSLLAAAGSSLAGAGHLVTRTFRREGRTAQAPRSIRSGADELAPASRVVPSRKGLLVQTSGVGVHALAVSRHIFNEIRRLHTGRSTCQAKEAHSENGPVLRRITFRDVCSDVHRATRKWMCAVKMVTHMQEAALQRAATRARSHSNTGRARRKILAFCAMSSMHTKLRDQQQFWQELWGAGVSRTPSQSAGLSACDSPTMCAIVSGASGLSVASERSRSAPSRRECRAKPCGVSTLQIAAGLSIRSWASNASGAEPDAHERMPHATPSHHVAAPVSLPGAVEESA